jgi:hypothetical protein
VMFHDSRGMIVSPIGLTILLAGFGSAPCASARAQSAAPAAQACHEEQDPVQDGGPARGNRPRPDRRPRGEGPPGGAIESLIRPAPGDARPVSPDEQEALWEFARRELPGPMVRHMQRLQQRDPAAFQERFARQMAPRLRWLRRVFARDPELGRAFVAHTRLMHDARRLAEQLRRPADDWAEHARAHDSLRSLVAESLRIEVRILRTQAHVRRETREQEIELGLASVTADEADLMDWPPDVRDVVAQWTHAADEDERVRLREILRGLVARRVDNDIIWLEQRAERLEREGAQEVDLRVRRLVEDARPGMER